MLDHLHDHTVSLRRCTVVCKEWTHTSQYHLFAILSYRPLSAGTPEVFAEFLSTRPHIAGNVRSLGLLDRSDFSLEAVRSIILALPNLRSVLFRSVVVTNSLELETSMNRHSHPPAKTIKKAKFIKFAATDNTLYLILGLFCSIDHLVLDDRSDGLVYNQPTHLVPRALAVRKIAMNSVSNVLFSSLIGGSHMAQTITSVKIMGFGKQSDTPQALGEVLRSISSMTSLELFPTGYQYDPMDLERESNFPGCVGRADRCLSLADSLWERLGLFRCKALQVLELPIPFAQHVNEMCMWLIHWFSAVPHLPVSIKEMQFAMVCLPKVPVASSKPNMGLWAVLDRAIMDAPPQIHVKITLKEGLMSQITPVGEREAMKAVVFECLPETVKSGRLVIFE